MNLVPYIRITLRGLAAPVARIGKDMYGVSRGMTGSGEPDAPEPGGR